MNTSFPHDFRTTRWTLVINAGNPQSSRHESALNELCRLYRFPLYAYARHRGNAHADAEDLVQDFFSSQVLQTNFLQGLNSKKGRFRAYLLACFKNHLLKEWKRSCCQKRGGGAEHLPLNGATDDDKYRVIAAGTPERAYDQACLITLLEEVLALLGQEMQGKGKRELFDLLKPFLTPVDRDTFSYRDAAIRLKLSEEAVRAAASRLLKRYRELFIQEIRKTCDPAQLQEEISSLLNAFSD